MRLSRSPHVIHKLVVTRFQYLSQKSRGSTDLLVSGSELMYRLTTAKCLHHRYSLVQLIIWRIKSRSKLRKRNLIGLWRACFFNTAVRRRNKSYYLKLSWAFLWHAGASALSHTLQQYTSLTCYWCSGRTTVNAKCNSVNSTYVFRVSVRHVQADERHIHSIHDIVNLREIGIAGAGTYGYEWQNIRVSGTPLGPFFNRVVFVDTWQIFTVAARQSAQYIITISMYCGIQSHIVELFIWKVPFRTRSVQEKKRYEGVMLHSFFAASPTCSTVRPGLSTMLFPKSTFLLQVEISIICHNKSQFCVKTARSFRCIMNHDRKFASITDSSAGWLLSKKSKKILLATAHLQVNSFCDVKASAIVKVPTVSLVDNEWEPVIRRMW